MGSSTVCSHQSAEPDRERLSRLALLPAGTALWGHNYITVGRERENTPAVAAEVINESSRLSGDNR